MMTCMRQLNVNVTPELEADLRKLMKQRNLTRKSDAIRLAVHEAAAKGDASRDYDYRMWLGQGLRAPLRRKPRFRSEDELWS
jgi:hypothetical protein